MRAAIVLLAAAVFGAADQYLGSLSAHPWLADASLLSAPWLALPFLAGWWGRSAREAAVLGAGATFTALVGYLLMTFSPVENAHLTVNGVLAFLRYGNYLWFLAGSVTGPLFGWLAHLGRTRRTPAPLVGVALLLCLEPAVHLLRGSAIRSGQVAAVEVAIGAALVAAGCRAQVRRLRQA